MWHVLEACIHVLTVPLWLLRCTHMPTHTRSRFLIARAVALRHLCVEVSQTSVRVMCVPDGAWGVGSRCQWVSPLQP